jgi:hypothetical protein
MALVSMSILSRSKRLAQNLRQEGRVNSNHRCRKAASYI